MLFNSFSFIFAFLPLTLGVYWGLRSRGLVAASNLSLLAASFWFYYLSEPHYRVLLLASISVNYFLGMAVRGEWSSRRWILLMGLVFNLGILAYYKYGNFALQNLRAVSFDIPQGPYIDLPVGISFFTFTQVAYLVDCYRYRFAEMNIGRYGLFVIFFPHLIAGPILHHSEMMPQFRSSLSGSHGDRFASAALMFTIGLFKKVVIADSLGATASQIFASASGGVTVSLLPAWVAALCYGLQIYFDFSGYSDMAIGIARALGIELPINFNSPYKSVSIADFWRRWHISLSRFLRDYLYVPIGGNRRGPVRTYANLLITMVLGGLWHGASWNFVIWGAIHGAWLALERLGKRVLGNSPDIPAPLLRTFIFLGVMVAWIPFRAPDFETTLVLWKGMAGLSGFVFPLEWPGMSSIAGLVGAGLGHMDLHPVDLVVLAFALSVAFFFPNSQEALVRFNLGLDSLGYFARGRASARWLVALDIRWAAIFGILFGIALAFVGGYSEFIYFQF